MGVISLLTDFGTDDEYVGLMKAVIYRIHPAAVVVDLCHEIPPQDIRAAALLLKSAWVFFPEKSVHLVVIDPGVGTDRGIVALRSAGHVFVAPDNGVLGPVLENAEPLEAVRVENREFFLPQISRTFHGRDILAPVGAHLMAGIGMDRLGPRVRAEELKRCELKTPKMGKDGELVGTIVSVDRFGNLITDIPESALDGFIKERKQGEFEILAAGRTVAGLMDSYAGVAPGGAMGIIGSRGSLEIAVNRGSAAEVLGCKRGDSVRLRKRG